MGAPKRSARLPVVGVEEVDRSLKRRLSLALVIAFVGALSAQEPGPAPVRYNPAVAVVNSGLVVFPPDGKEFRVPIPLTFSFVVFAPNGRGLYATSFKQLGEASFTSGPGLFKIELDPVRVVTVLPGFESFGRFAVSRREDKVLFSGSSRGASDRTCGVFELTLLGRNVRPVLQTRCD